MYVFLYLSNKFKSYFYTKGFDKNSNNNDNTLKVYALI